MPATEKTQGNQSNLIPFKPGQSGNPAGRPRGVRNKLGEAFIEALHDDFAEHGIAAVEQVRLEKPDQYLKVIASLMPKELTLNVGDAYSEMTDAELLNRLGRLQEALAAFIPSGDGNAQEGAGGTGCIEVTAKVH